VVLDQGCVLEQGSHEQLMAAGGVYRDMWQMQAARAALGSVSEDEEAEGSPEAAGPLGSVEEQQRVALLN
jgi:hypothetical protein